MDENLIIGRNSVREAIKSGRDIDSISVQKGDVDGSLREIITLAKKNHIIVKQVPLQKLDELSMPFGYAGKPGNHQGIAAHVPSFRYAQMEDIFQKAESLGESPFIVILEQITDPHNLGAIIRSAEVFGAHGVVIPARRSAMLTAAVLKAASGAAEYVPVVKVGNLTETIRHLKEKGVWIAVADMDGKPARKVDLTGPLALVIGSEGEGVSRLVKENGDYVVRIEMAGQISSLNASAAAAVLMYEKRRQELERQPQP